MVSETRIRSSCRKRKFFILLSATFVGSCTQGLTAITPEGRSVTEAIPRSPAKASGGSERFVRREKPNRTEVYSPDNAWLATFTEGSFSVTSLGPKRLFAEPSTTSVVEHSVWVRTLDQVFDGKIDEQWLKAALRMNEKKEDDILSLAFQYGPGSPPIFNEEGLQIAGDASYGPESSSGKRLKGSDVLDYIGEDVRVMQRSRSIPKTDRIRSLDCSGYMRMIWGFRNEGVTGFTRNAHESKNPLLAMLPRTSDEMARLGPGIVLPIDNEHRDFSQLQVGDLLFFDANSDKNNTIDHVALFLGEDNNHHFRFISSRKSSDGPTMGDMRGPSIIDGEGHFARSFRSARRF